MVVGLGLALTWTTCGGPARPDVPELPDTTGSAGATPTASPVNRPTPSPMSDALAASSPSPPAALDALTDLNIEEAFPKLSFPEMLYMTYPDDDSNRLFVVLKAGKIMTFRNERDAGSASPFLDIRERVRGTGSEEGLLGLAFDPGYRANGNFYVYYSASSPRRSIISRFTVSPTDADVADPGSERIILEVAQPYANHNGGQILIGPDGYLYIGLGDGGSGGDPEGNGQDLSTLLGTILRIDVRDAAPEIPYAIPEDNPFVDGGDAARAEIWAFGLRNPWRFSFDRETSVLWAADVGQNSFEEIDIVKPGLNYGWNVMEGLHCFGRTRGACDKGSLALPTFEYDHSEGCSVTGGYVYRGGRLPSLNGWYVFGDFCSGKIWGIRYDGATVTEHVELADSQIQISSFAEDQLGEIYILDFRSTGGKIYRFASP